MTLHIIMVENSLNGTMKITADSQLKIHNGQLLSVRVIKPLTAQKWAISIMGRVYPAQTGLDLKPEQILKVKVLRTGRQLQLKLINEKSIPPLMQSLKNQGFTADPVTAQIAAALLHSGLPVLPENLDQLRNKLLKTDKGGQILLRLLVNLLGKDLDLAAPGIDELMRILDYGSDPQHRRHPSGQKKKKWSRQQIKEKFTESIVSESPGCGQSLQIFNHLKEQNESWVVIPYDFITEKSSYHGTFRLLLNNNDLKIKKAVFILYTGEKEKWSFFMQPYKKLINIIVFSNNKLYIGRQSESFQTLITNLQNNGVKIDDIIYDDKDFDGFEPIERTEKYQAVDTLI